MTARTVLVGNGPSALDKELGEVIDGCETVIRFNTFHLDKFERFIGHRTTIWAVNLGYVALPDHGIRWTPSYPQPRTICFVPWTLDLYPGYEKVRAMPMPPLTEMCEEAVAKDADSFYRGTTWASTGLMAVMQFLPCAIVGFDCFMAQKHHYGDDVGGCYHHAGNTELDWIDEQVKSGKLIKL